MMDAAPTITPKTSKRKKRRGKIQQNFTSYISFGITSTMFACCFLLVYLLMMIGLLPLLSNFDATESTTGNGNGVAGGGSGSSRINNLHELPIKEQEKEVFGEMADNLKKKLSHLRNARGMTDIDLKQLAIKEFEELRKWRHTNKQQQQQQQAQNNGVGSVSIPINKNIVPPLPGRRPGFVVLGMHRSGTSMLSGLLVQGLGYNVGGPLIGAHFDNQKGFFERIDVVLQNDEFLKSQGIWWSSGVRNYNSDKANEDLNAKKIKFEEGNKALAFLNNHDNAPWLQKDPRMCITLKTWLKLIQHEPAVLFTYRHPLEVALSLVHREKFPLELGLRLWIIYNMRAIQNSKGLCRVFSSNDAILADPLGEVKRIASEMSTNCGVPDAPREITQEDVDIFIDPNMQHGKKEIGAGKAIVETYHGCDIPDFDHEYQPNTPDYDREKRLYIISMKLHCDFKSGEAYKDDYVWPELP